MRIRTRLLALTAAACALAGAAPAIASATTTASPRTDVSATQLCAPLPERKVCLSDRAPAAGPTAARGAGLRPAAASPTGYGPADLRSAYRVPNSSTTATVAIVDAYDAPNVAADLASYRSSYGLPACTSASGCFRKVNQSGAASPLPAADSGWAGETTLDVEMVSAVCPSCHILLVESTTDDRSGAPDMERAVTTAANLGARYVSMSWGGDEWGGERSADAAFLNRAGVAYVAASGDYDYGTSWPAVNPNVVSVGGTSLTRAANARGWTEAVWGQTDGTGTGSGCSGYEPRAGWQAIAPITSLCPRRAMNDLSVVADPATGVSVYQDGSWWRYGGTSVGAPLVAAMYAMAGLPSTAPAASYPYAHRSAFNDVTTNANGYCGNALCRAGTGWDGPTGVGTPNGVSGLKAPNLIAVHNPGTITTFVGRPTSINTVGTDSGHLALTYTATGAPTGTAVHANGYVTGTPTRLGTYTVTVTARDASGGSGHASFRCTVVAHRFVAGAAPRITGPAAHGALLTAHWGTFRADSSRGPVVHPALTVQWYANGVAVAGATHTTFRIPAVDRGRRISVRVTARLANFSAYAATSAATAVVR